MYQQNYNTYVERDNYSYVNADRKRNTRNNPKNTIIMGVVFWVIGILITIVQFNEYQDYKALVKEGNSTNAIVTDVDKKTSTTRSRRRGSTGTRRRTKKTYYYVTATYTVDRENYTLNFKSNSYYVNGEKIKIFYDEDNPSDYVREGDSGVDTLVIGVLVIVVGGIFGGSGYKKYRDEKDLKAMGLL